MKRDVGIQSIVRVLIVMEALNRRNISSVDVLHSITGLPKPTLIRILGTLIGAGYIFHVSRRDGYVLTEKILRLSAGFRYHDAIVDIARPLLEAFTEEHKWQLSIATLDADAMRVRFNTRHLSPFSPEQRYLNKRLGMLNSALGRAYLAYCSDIERDSIIKLIRAAQREGDGQVRDFENFDPLIETIRTRRYAIAERQPGDPVRSFAVPILLGNAREGVLGSIALFYFGSVMTEAQATNLFLDKVYAIGQRITDALSAMHEVQAEKTIALSEAPQGPWPADHAGAKGDPFRRIEALELENARLRRVVSDLALEKQILAETTSLIAQAPVASRPTWKKSRPT